MISSSREINDIMFNAYYEESSDYIHFCPYGGIYRKTQDQYGNYVWTVLINKLRVCGWYHVESPFVSDRSHAGATSLGGQAQAEPTVNLGNGNYLMCSPSSHKLKSYHINNISYLVSEDKWGDEQITLFISTGERGLLGMIDGRTYVNGDESGPDSQFIPRDPWTSGDYQIGEPEIQDMFNASFPMDRLPFYNPTSSSPYLPPETFEQEYRADPWTGKLYNRQEFYEYYGRYIEWDIQCPYKVMKRLKINDMILRYSEVLYGGSMDHLLDAMIETFM